MTKIYVTTDGIEFSSKELAMEYQELKTTKDNEFAEKRLEYLKLRDISNKALNDVFEFQENCPHTFVKVKAESDTGNWCKSDDSYWYSIECKCCSKHWTEDQSTSKYRGSDDNVEWVR